MQENGETQFHNRGYEVWEQCRDAWRNSVISEDEGIEVAAVVRSPRKQLSNSQRRYVVAGLTRQREFQLPRRIPLSDLIGLYQDIWHQDSSD